MKLTSVLTELCAVPAPSGAEAELAALLEARWATLGRAGGEAVMAILWDDSEADVAERRLARKHALISDSLDLG